VSSLMGASVVPTTSELDARASWPCGVLMLNPTGHAIVSLCTGDVTFQEIVEKLAARYKVSAEEISPQVADYLNRLRERNLLETGK